MRIDRPPRAAALGIVLAPTVAAAQASAAGNTGTPLLWLWVLVAVALVAAIVVLLFVGPRRRTRAHVMERARRQVHDRA